MSIELKKNFDGTVVPDSSSLVTSHSPITDDSDCDFSHVYLVGDIDITGMNSTLIKAYCRSCRDEASFIYEWQEGNRWVMVEE